MTIAPVGSGSLEGRLGLVFVFVVVVVGCLVVCLRLNDGRGLRLAAGRGGGLIGRRPRRRDPCRRARRHPRARRPRQALQHLSRRRPWPRMPSPWRQSPWPAPSRQRPLPEPSRRPWAQPWLRSSSAARFTGGAVSTWSSIVVVVSEVTVRLSPADACRASPGTISDTSKTLVKSPRCRGNLAEPVDNGSDHLLSHTCR